MGTRRVFFHLRVAFFFSQMTRFTSSSSTGSCYRSQSGYTLWVVHLHGYYQIQRPCMGGLGGGCGKSNHKSPTWKLDVRRTFCERGKIWFFFPFFIHFYLGTDTPLDNACSWLSCMEAILSDQVLFFSWLCFCYCVLFNRV